MEKELTIKDKVTNPIIIQHDDLKFDGKTITIPRYYIDSLCEYIRDYKTEKESQADIEDFQAFRSFLYDVQEYNNGGN
jgi:uncharacterized protein (DUF1919 family)